MQKYTSVQLEAKTVGLQLGNSHIVSMIPGSHILPVLILTTMKVN